MNDSSQTSASPAASDGGWKNSPLVGWPIFLLVGFVLAINALFIGVAMSQPDQSLPRPSASR